MDEFIDSIKTNIEIMNEYNGNIRRIFTIATTSKQEISPYTTPLRITNEFVLCGCVIFSQDVVYDICTAIDGKVDIVLVDTEKKIPFKISSRVENNVKEQSEGTIGTVETGNLSKICFNYIKKSEIYEYKPNDLTVNAAWSFLSQRLHYLSGRKVAILGSGNIGSKLALKLVECGSNVHIHRTNDYKGEQITQGLNFIKPNNTVSNISFHKDKLQTSFMADILIGATNGYQVIDVDTVMTIKNSAIIIDLGKNNITPDAIKIAMKNNIEIYRVDVTPALEGFVYELLKMNEILKYSYGKCKLGEFDIVGGGFFGLDGDIVVDNITSPKQVFGIADGKGSLKQPLDSRSRLKIQLARGMLKND